MTVVLAAEPQEHQAGFVTGVALAPTYSPVWPAYMQAGLQEIRHHLHARWLFLTPTWSATRINLPVFEPVPGYDPLWQDVVTLNALARQADLQVAFYPMLRFPTTADDWWAQAARDFGWWNAWFARYRDFALNFADAAAATGAQILVLGGEWVAPALPGGLLPNGQAAGVPADADLRSNLCAPYGVEVLPCGRNTMEGFHRKGGENRIPLVVVVVRRRRFDRLCTRSKSQS